MPETLRSQSTAPCAVSLALTLKGRNVPSELEDFIDRHVGRDRRQPYAETAGIVPH